MSERHKQINQIWMLLSLSLVLGLTTIYGLPGEIWLYIISFAPQLLQWWLKLSNRQAAELRGTHVIRPPPKPDPPLGKNKQRIICKALLEVLRAEWYARRLTNKRKGKHHRKQQTRLSKAVIGVGLSSVLVLSTAMPPFANFWRLTLPAGLLLVIWSFMQAGSWLVRQLDKYTDKDSSPIIRFGTKAMHSVRIPDGDFVELATIESVRLSCYVVGCTISYLIGSAPLTLVQWTDFTFGDGWMHQLLGLGEIAFSRLKNSLLRLTDCLFCLLAWWLIIPPIDAIFKILVSYIWRIMVVTWLFIKLLFVDFNDEWLVKTTSPIIKQVVASSYRFVELALSEFKAKWLENAKSEGELLDELIRGTNEMFTTEEMTEPWDWKSLSKPQDFGCMMAFRLPNDYPEVEHIYISDMPDFIPTNGRQRAGYVEDDDSKRWSDSVMRDQDKQLDSLVNKAMIGIPLTEPTAKDISISPNDKFVGSFNPAVAGADLLMVERYDQRRAPKRKCKVTVDLQKCRSMMRKYFKGNICLLPAYEEFVLNVAGPSALPLIVDSGASCCVSPNREDFIEGTYRPSEVKIKDLSGVNKVAGKGMLRWSVQDMNGRVHDIEIQGYHVPQASVRLLSPQSMIRKFGGNGWFDEYKFVINIKKFNVELHAPYGLANLPILPMSTSSSVSRWSEVFMVNSAETDIWGRSILDARNQNLSSAQKELLLWHHKLSHAGLSKVHNLCRQKKKSVRTAEELIALRDGPYLPCSYNVPNAVCDNLLCAACAISKATRRKPTIVTSGKQEKEMVLKEDDLQPGDCISCDHYVSPVPGRAVSQSGHCSASHGYVGGTLYVDHASGWIFHRAQRSIAASDTIRGKLILEREAADVGVKIKKYHSDNGVFSSNEFRQHCTSLGQELTFSGVGAKFQNGVAERGIGTICNMARANMLHATLHWPGFKFISFWALAMTYAIWCYNRLPSDSDDDGRTPEELWSKTKLSARSTVKRARVFGCPVYVLDPKLQDGKSIPKWKSKARQGVFVGFSEEHSSTVALVYNPTTQHVSPQYHVIFDDTFSTVPALASESKRDELFEKLYDNGSGDSVEYYIDSKDADAGRVTDSWIESGENKASEGDGDIEQEGDRELTKGSEGVSEPILAPEGAVTSKPSPPSLHRNESRPISNALSENDSTKENEDKASSPRYPQRIRKKVSFLSGLLAAPQYVMTAASSWSQQPAAVANVGTRYAAKKDVVKRAYINELALLSEDWNTVAQDIQLGIGAFTSYMQPDLFEDPEELLLADIQPHVLKAKVSANPADTPTYTQAMNSPNADEWNKAAHLEVETLENIKAWSLFRRADVPSNKKVLPMKWDFRLKRYPDGLPKKFKARYCVRGDRQVEGVDYDETWAPVVQWTTVRGMMILALKQGLATAQADITAAFVHAPLKPHEEIYVEQPKGFVYGEPGELVLKLHKSVYGIKQAPHNFFNFLVDQFKLEGLRQSDNDPCLFIGKKVTAIVYVDDILFFSKDDSEIDKIIGNLVSRNVQIRREGSAEGFLGVAVDRVTNGQTHQIKMTQAGLAKRIVEALGLCSVNSTPISTPAEASPLPKDLNGAPCSGHFNYAAVVGMMLYLSGHTRPDIAFAVHQCARYTFNPTRKHEVALIRIGRYLKGTMDKDLIMTPTDDPRVDCYPDADFAGLYGHEDVQDPHCARSRTGYVITAFGCPVLWRSKLQTEIALSTMEAEYVAISAACKDLFPVVNMIKELSRTVGLSDDFNSNIHVKIHEDNVGALTLGRLEPRRMTPRSKHYAIKYHWFRTHVADPSKRISLVKIDTRNQLGDIFTKGLTKDSFERLRFLLMGW